MKDKKHPLVTSTAAELKEKHLGPVGTPKRDAYEKELAEEIAREQSINSMMEIFHKFKYSSRGARQYMEEIYNQQIQPLQQQIEQLQATLQEKQNYIIELERRLANQ